MVGCHGCSRHCNQKKHVFEKQKQIKETLSRTFMLPNEYVLTKNYKYGSIRLF